MRRAALLSIIGVLRRGPDSGLRPADGFESGGAPGRAGEDGRVNGPDGLRQETAALRERISRLNAAILPISASLDLDTLLHEVVDSARALTGARYGMIATVDEAGTIREFVAAGMSAHERRHICRHMCRHIFGLAARTPVLRTPPGPSGRATAGGPARPRPLARLLRGFDAVEDLKPKGIISVA